MTKVADLLRRLQAPALINESDSRWTSSAYIRTSCAKTFSQMLQGSNWPGIEFTWLDSGDLNAFAVSDQDLHLVALHGGAADILVALFQMLFSRQRFMPHLGSAQSERDLPLEVPFVHTTRQLLDWDSATGGLTSPKSEDRRLIATLCAMTALDFIVAHELRHVIAGHTRWRTTSNARSESGNELHRDEALISQTLEVDADGHGVKFVAFGFLRRFAPNSEACRLLPAKNRNSTDVLSILCAALYPVFFCLGMDATRITDWQAWSHPHPRYRGAILYAALHSLLSTETFAPFRAGLRDAAGMAVAPIGKAFVAFTKNFEASFKKSFPDAAAYDVEVGASARRLDEYNVTWESLLPQLRKVAFVQLAEKPG